MNPRVLIAMCFVVAWSCPCRRVSADSTDAWPGYAHDGALTARSSLHGNIVKPQSRWSFSVAGRELLLEIIPIKGEHTLRLVAEEFGTPIVPPKVPSPGPLQLDLDG